MTKRLMPAVVVAIFVVLAIASTWPLITDPADSFLARPNNNDARFNIWVIFWGAHALTTDPLNLHHANIFHDEPYTFAYSDIELSHSLLMYPVIATTYNPELTYNLLILLSIVIGGTGFYVLGKRLTGSHLAGIIGGAIFVFNPAHFGRFYQIQFFCDHWLPWFCWALIVWLDAVSARVRGNNDRSGALLPWSLLAAVFYCLHCLSGSHGAVFGTVLGGMLILYRLIRNSLWKSRHFWIGIALFAAVSLLVLVPVFYPYILIQDELKSVRVSDMNTLRAGSADTYELVSAGSPFYRWLDRVTRWPSAVFDSRLRGYLFTGLVPLVLAFFGLLRASDRGPIPHAWKKPLAWILDLVPFLMLWAVIGILDTGTRYLYFFPVTFQSPPVVVFASVAVVALLLRFVFVPGEQHAFLALAAGVRKRIDWSGETIFWAVIFLFTIWASLGPDAGLYRILGNIPFVNLIRVPRRFILLGTFALGVLSAYGVRNLLRTKKTGGKWPAAVFITVLMIVFTVESAFAPVPIYPLEKDRPHELYTWLGEQEGDFAVYEFPIGPRSYTQFVRQVYNSIYHWKKLIVGYSGYQSERNIALLSRLLEHFPDNASLDELQSLNVRYVIVFDGRDYLRDQLAAQTTTASPEEIAKLRSSLVNQDAMWKKIEAQPRLAPARTFDGIVVMELRPAEQR